MHCSWFFFRQFHWIIFDSLIFIYNYSLSSAFIFLFFFYWLRHSIFFCWGFFIFKCPGIAFPPLFFLVEKRIVTHSSTFFAFNYHINPFTTELYSLMFMTIVVDAIVPLWLSFASDQFFSCTRHKKSESQYIVGQRRESVGKTKSGNTPKSLRRRESAVEIKFQLQSSSQSSLRISDVIKLHVFA